MSLSACLRWDSCSALPRDAVRIDPAHRHHPGRGGREHSLVQLGRWAGALHRHRHGDLEQGTLMGSYELDACTLSTLSFQYTSPLSSLVTVFHTDLILRTMAGCGEGRDAQVVAQRSYAGPGPPQSPCTSRHIICKRWRILRDVVTIITQFSQISDAATAGLATYVSVTQPCLRTRWCAGQPQERAVDRHARPSEVRHRPCDIP
jgi:hypothetical protein